MDLTYHKHVRRYWHKLSVYNNAFLEEISPTSSILCQFINMNNGDYWSLYYYFTEAFFF